MRIAMLAWESLHSIAIGGVAAHVTELAATLIGHGHEMHVFTRLAPGQRHHEVIAGVHYHRCSYLGHPDFVEDTNAMCRAMVDRVLAIEDFVGHFDVIHAHDWLTANAMIWIKQGRRHPCLLTIHSTEYGRNGNAFPGGQAQRIRAQERAGTFWADHVIAVSAATRDEVMWMYEVPPPKITAIHNGVDAGRFAVGADAACVKASCDIPKLAPTVLFCGRLALQKGPDILLEAAPAVLDDYPETHFLFAGDGYMRDELSARARQLGIDGAVHLLGFRQGQNLIDLYRSAEIVCVPSRNEPFGIVVLEAWSASKPVVVTKVGGPNEYVEHDVTGLKVEPTPASVQWGLSALLPDAERARRLGQCGRQAVAERFSWDQIARQTLIVYGRLVASLPTPAVAEPTPNRPSATRRQRKALAHELSHPAG